MVCLPGNVFHDNTLGNCYQIKKSGQTEEEMGDNIKHWDGLNFTMFQKEFEEREKWQEIVMTS